MGKTMSSKSDIDNKQQLAQQLYVTKLAYKGLTQPVESPKVEQPQPVLFNDIFQLVKGSRNPKFVVRIASIMAQINQDINLRRVYKNLLEQCKFAESTMQAAASSSSGELLDRITEQFTLKFKRDKTCPSQVYLILSIHHPNEHHNNDGAVVHIHQDDLFDCLLFPAFCDGKSQLLIEDKESVFSLLTDQNSRLILV